ncbi:MAG: HlyD family secretion protein [Roseiarcus sp.]|jgi:membrane fusion protein (multidrug efflux system)
MTERFGLTPGCFEMSQDQTHSPSVALAPTHEHPPMTAVVAREAAVAPESAAPPSARAPRSRRRFILPVILLAALGYGGYFAYDWFVEGRFLVTTDDAYVGADTAIIAAKVAAHVAEVAVDENAFVHAGDLLVRLDGGDYRLAVDAAKAKIATQDATIARIGRQVEAQDAAIAQAAAQVGSAAAQLQGAEADQQRASLEFDRSQKLAETNFGSQQRLEQATADRARTAAAAAGANAAKASAEAALAGAKDNLDVLKAQQTEAVRVRGELATAEEKAERDLSFTEIRAPFDGVVGNKAVEVGQYAQPGTRLLALVPLSSAYIDANFKETQLDSIHPGQKVDIAVDSYGGRVISGVVASIAPASGAQFSLLPPDNATGNFTKVVQRIAVRIAVAPEALKEGTLRPGLSVVASVHTRDESLPKPTLLGLFGFGAAAGEQGARP